MRKFLSFLALAALLAPSFAYAADDSAHGYISIGAGIGVGLAGLGGGLGQGKLAASALESIGRNPASTGKLFLPMLLALAFVESLVILAFVVSFFLYQKV